MEPIVSLGAWIRRRRKSLDFTQPALADCVGSATITIQKIEADERRPSEQMAERLAECLKIPADERAAFLQSARGERAPDRLPSPQPEQPLPSSAAADQPFPHNLPASATLPLGRDAELATLTELILQPQTRLITLVGPGGVGKTTLSLALAHSFLDPSRTSFRFGILDSVPTLPTPHSALRIARFPDGIWFIELAALDDPALVAQIVAAPFGLPQQSTHAYGAALANFLQYKRALLILDNCEHLLSACATLAQQLLRASPGLTLLATSREPLNIGGEQEWRVQPLPTPELPLGRKSSPIAAEISALPSVQCFVRRAQAVQSHFQLSDQNALAISRICQQVDGLPLALELAAARVKSIGVEEISRRLSSELGAGFSLLTSGRRNALPHQQTLRATLDWSYALLNDGERQLFHALAVFVGGFTLADAEGIASAGDDLLDLLASLVDKSLVVVRNEPTGDLRYHLLETIRHYAWEKSAASGQLPVLRQRHLAWFARWAPAAERGFTGHEQARWLARLDREQDNCRAALTFALDHNRPLGLDLLMAIWQFWSVRGWWGEQDDWLRRFQITIEEATPTLASVKALALSAHTHKKAERDRYFAASVQLAERIGDQSGLAFAYLQQANSHWWRDTDAAHHAFTQSETIARNSGDRWQLAQILRARGEFDYTRLDARADARSHMAESLELFRQLGDRYGMADALVHLADVAFEQGDLTAAQQYGAEGLALSRTLNFRYGILWGVMVLGSVAGGTGDFAQSNVWLEECVTVARELGSATFLALALYWQATTFRFAGELQQAQALYNECQHVAQKDNEQSMLGGAAYGLGEIARQRGEYTEAEAHYQQALTIWQGIAYQWGLARVTASLALLALAQGRADDATQLLSAAATIRHQAALGLTPLEQEEIDAAQRRLQSLLGAAHFAE